MLCDHTNKTTFASGKSVNSIRKSQSNEATYLSNLETYKHDAIKAAKDLKYGDDVIHKIKLCKTMNEVTCLMSAARIKKFT